MKILQFTKQQLIEMDADSSSTFLIVESQPYGLDSDIYYNAVMSDETAELFLEKDIGRRIADKGRTVGFFQHIGSGGVFEPKNASLTHFSETALAVLKKLPNAKILVHGETWNEILQAISNLQKSFVDSLNLKSIGKQQKRLNK